MTWTDARIAQLARLWAEGQSASKIAEALGDVSRSAVLGKLLRLNLLGSRAAASAPRRYDGPVRNARWSEAARADAGIAGAARQAAGPPPAPPRSPWREAAFAPLQGTEPRPWLSREAGECAFPVGGDGVEIVSCCAPARPRSAYCEAHHRVVFKAVSQSARAAEQRRWAEAVERWAA
jgi:GcrA cell cycle regulator